MNVNVSAGSSRAFAKLPLEKKEEKENFSLFSNFKLFTEEFYSFCIQWSGTLDGSVPLWEINFYVFTVENVLVHK